MFVSFFPHPRLFFTTALAWTAFLVVVWYAGGSELGPAIGLPAAPGAFPIGAARFWSPHFLWFYVYFVAAVLIFFAAWQRFAPHPYAWWSILGSALIFFVTYFQVQVSVAINAWYGPFYDMIQAAVSKSRPVTLAEFYGEFATFAGIAFIAVTVYVLTRFFVSHYVFRWRTAMNDYFTFYWRDLRGIEGAAQRIQDDTMRFATTTEALGVNFIDAVLTLTAFLPILLRLSTNVTELPLVGHIPAPLVIAAIVWSVVGTAFLALVGIRLPRIEFGIQRVEASYRKELVIGEDDANRADPPTLKHLFVAVRRNYFSLYLNFMYFNIARYLYLQTDIIFPYIVLAPTIVAGKITLGPMQQILSAFGRVRESFQYLINSWSTIVELISIYLRLRAFEATLGHRALSDFERDAAEAG